MRLQLRRQTPLLAVAIFWLLSVVAVPAFASLGAGPGAQEAFEGEVGGTAPTLVPKAAAGEGLGSTAAPRFYEVGFEARLERGVHYPGVSDARHFQEANRQLYEAMQADVRFAAQMEELYPGIAKGVAPGPQGAFPRRPPTPDVTWHHNSSREGVLELMRRVEHRSPGPVQQLLHPDGRGGMEVWGGGRRK